MGTLIFGRSPNLVLGALTALFNVAVTFHVGSFDPTLDQITIVNVAFGALIALIAGSDTATRSAAVEADKRTHST